MKVDPKLWKEVKIQAIREDIEVSVFTERALKKELEGSGLNDDYARRLKSL